MILYSTFDPAVQEKLNAEVDANLDPISDDLKNKFTIDVADNFNYMFMCYNESLRIVPPAVGSDSSCFSEDVNIGGVNIRARDSVFLNIDQIHHDPAQWQ